LCEYGVYLEDHVAMSTILLNKLSCLTENYCHYGYYAQRDEHYKDNVKSRQITWENISGPLQPKYDA